MANQMTGCPVCQSRAFSVIEKSRQADRLCSYDICHSCGVIFMDPQPTDEELKEYYTDSYWQAHSKGVTSLQKQHLVAESIKRYLERHTSNGFLNGCNSVLEIGSSFGVTLNEIGAFVRQRGGAGKLFAIEPSTLAREFGADNYRAVTLIGATADDLAKSTQNYDLVILSHVLEHFTDPVKALRLVLNRLSPSGLLYIEVPNYYGHPSVEYSHNFCFTPGSLTRTLALSGFRIVSMDVWHRNRAFPMYITCLVSPAGGGAQSQQAVVRPNVVRAARKVSAGAYRGYMFAATGVRRVRSAAARLVKRSLAVWLG